MKKKVTGAEMEFRDLKKQYECNRERLERAVLKTLECCVFIGGETVDMLEKELARYAGTEYCISCANGTDAMLLALIAWGTGPGDAVFVPDFTFFSTAEVVVLCGAEPVFVDVDRETFNISPDSLRLTVEKVKEEGRLVPKVVIPVDLFGLPADYGAIKIIAEEYGLKILEDGAQGFGGRIGERKACSFGEISTTSFFPAKPLGCYGDGGALFTDDEDVKNTLSSLKVHGRGMDKYDNVRVGMNSRLDTIQAAVLLEKLRMFEEYELEMVNQVSEWYRYYLGDCVRKPFIPNGYYSSWAQYTIVVKDKQTRTKIQEGLKEFQIPSMIYYKKPLHRQGAFRGLSEYGRCSVTEELCDRVLSLPMHPYLDEEEVVCISEKVNELAGY